MARPPSKQPTDGELEILKVLWETGPAGLGQIHAVLEERRGVAITTVATMLKMMLTKEMVERQDGPRGYLWTARVSRKATVSGLLGKLVQHVFDGSARRLVAHLIEEDELDDRERDEIMVMLKSRQEKDKKSSPKKKGDELMISTLLAVSPVSTAVGWTMLHVVWVGAVIGLTASLARRMFKSARPETRYGVTLMCLLALSVSPVLIFAWVFEREPGPRTLIGATSSNVSASAPSVQRSDRPLRARTADRELALGWLDVAPARSRAESLVPFLAWFWLCGSGFTLAMLATGLIGVERLRRSSRLLESGEISRRCKAVADSLGIARRVSVGICDRVAMPVLIGIVRPLILLPPIALSGWSIEQLEMVLLHELAHLRRWDNLVNLLQRSVESLLFFHPVVWWLSGWVRFERELCCDRLVVERLGQPVAYAEMLVALSGSSHRNPQAVVAMADGQVLTRIRRLLNLEERSMKLSMPEGLGLLGAVVVGVLLVLGAQGAQTKPVDDLDKTIRSVPGTAVDDAKEKPVLATPPLSERVLGKDTIATTRRPNRVPPRDPRATNLFCRDERRLQIVKLPTTPEGVVTYKCRGGTKIVCKRQNGTTSLEADEAVIERVEGRRSDESAIGPRGETWFEEADVPMKVHLKGNVILRYDEEKIAGDGGSWTLHARELDYNLVTGRLTAQNVKGEVAPDGFKFTGASLEIFPRLVGQPNVSLAPSKHREISAGDVVSPAPTGTANSAAENKNTKASAP